MNFAKFCYDWYTGEVLVCFLDFRDVSVIVRKQLLLKYGWSRSGVAAPDKRSLDFQWNGVCLLLLGFSLAKFLCTMSVFL